MFILEDCGRFLVNDGTGNRRGHQPEWEVAVADPSIPTSSRFTIHATTATISLDSHMPSFFSTERRIRMAFRRTLRLQNFLTTGHQTWNNARVDGVFATPIKYATRGTFKNRGCERHDFLEIGIESPSVYYGKAIEHQLRRECVDLQQPYPMLCALVDGWLK